MLSGGGSEIKNDRFNLAIQHYINGKCSKWRYTISEMECDLNFRIGSLLWMLGTEIWKRDKVCIINCAYVRIEVNANAIFQHFLNSTSWEYLKGLLMKLVLLLFASGWQQHFNTTIPNRTFDNGFDICISNIKQMQFK